MEKKLGLSALTALVLSSMLGAGVFSLPQNMAAVASPAALLIGWGITGAGILLLAFAMLILTRIRPELDGGIFTYAREGFGELIGFCSAWGYWLCAVIANVSYLVIVFSALSFFTDTPELRLFGDGNTWQSIVGASALLWIVHFLILRGVQTAASINLVATLAKLLPLGLFVVLAMMMFKLDTFKLDFTGLALGVPVWEQVKNTMLITLWVFIGVEGAVVVSARARNKRDVGKATLLAVLSALSDKAVSGNMIVVDKMASEEYKTKAVVAMLAAVGAGKKNLIVNEAVDAKFVKSAANIPGVKTTTASSVNTYDVVNADKMIISLEAAKKLEEVLG